jgi:hypothetical protein
MITTNEHMHPSSFAQKIANEIGHYISLCTKTIETETIERCAQKARQVLAEFEEELTEQQRKYIVDQIRRGG